MSFKKSQGLSMSTIVVAALALLVLSVMSIIFIGRMNTASDDVNSCVNNGGTCVPAELGSCQDAVENPNYEYIRSYTTGREMNNRCYTPTGDIDPDQMCCAFA